MAVRVMTASTQSALTSFEIFPINGERNAPSRGTAISSAGAFAGDKSRDHSFNSLISSTFTVPYAL